MCKVRHPAIRKKEREEGRERGERERGRERKRGKERGRESELNQPCTHFSGGQSID